MASKVRSTGPASYESRVGAYKELLPHIKALYEQGYDFFMVTSCCDNWWSSSIDPLPLGAIRRSSSRLWNELRAGGMLGGMMVTETQASGNLKDERGRPMLVPHIHGIFWAPPKTVRWRRIRNAANKSRRRFNPSGFRPVDIRPIGFWTDRETCQPNPGDLSYVLGYLLKPPTLTHHHTTAEMAAAKGLFKPAIKEGRMASKQTIAEIQSALASHQWRDVMWTHGRGGLVDGMARAIATL